MNRLKETVKERENVPSWEIEGEEEELEWLTWMRIADGGFPVVEGEQETTEKRNKIIVRKDHIILFYCFFTERFYSCQIKMWRIMYKND